MTEFYFGNNCTFCQSRIGSTHCLLPYQLVVGYIPPPDDISRIIDVTEIHMRYGLDPLQANLESINWMKSRPCSQQSQIYSNPIRAQSNQWSEQMNSVSDIIGSNLISEPTNITDPDMESNYSSYIAHELHFTQDEEKILMSDSPSYSEAASQDVGVTIKDSEPERLVSKNDQKFKSEPKVKEQPKLNALEKYNAEISRTNRNHLITDLVMIAKTAYNLHATQRDWIKTSQLKESIMYESDLRSKLNAKYKASSNTTLDGNKAFAKEIIAKHSPSEIQEWESGKFTSHGLMCLLNCRFTSLSSEDDESLQLCDELVKSFHAMTKPNVRNEDFLKIVVDAVKFELSKDGYPSAFEWMRNRAKFLETKKVSRSSTSSVKDVKEKVVKTKSPYPAVDERLINFINTHLQVFVNREIESAEDETPHMADETKLTTFFFKLSSEFLRRNKGWHNENSFTSPQHLAKLEELTGLKSRSSESSLTFSILKRIIDNFRTAFKQRYPKITS
jgi:hypothetical protein